MGVSCNGTDGHAKESEDLYGELKERLGQPSYGIVQMARGLTSAVCSGNPEELQVAMMLSMSWYQLYHTLLQMFIDPPTAERIAVMR